MEEMEAEKVAQPSASIPQPQYYPPTQTDPSEYHPAASDFSQRQSYVAVVTQPQRAVSYGYRNSDAGSVALSLAISTTVFAVCCCWWALFCSIPAIVFAANANTAVNEETARSSRNISLSLSGATVIAGIVVWVVAFGVYFGYNNQQDQNELASSPTHPTYRYSG